MNVKQLEHSRRPKSSYLRLVSVIYVALTSVVKKIKIFITWLHKKICIS